MKRRYCNRYERFFDNRICNGPFRKFNRAFKWENRRAFDFIPIDARRRNAKAIKLNVFISNVLMPSIPIVD